jgi:hypothetical protein
MQRLDLSDHHFPEILDGYKTNTIRRGFRRIEPGPLIFSGIIDPELTMMVMVTSVTQAPLIEIPKVISSRETIDELLVRLREPYPGIDANEMVTLIEFKAPPQRR